MAISGISMEKMDWTGALKALNDIKGVTATKEEKSIRITRTGDDGKPVSFTLEIPQLDDAEVFSTAELEKLIGNFDNLRSKSPFPVTETERLAFVNALKTSFNKVLAADPKTVNDLLGAGPKRGASKSLFDVYAIFKLLITVAQLQRNALRDVRQAENASVQKSILDQADEQRAAALAGLIGAVAVCVVQLSAQGVLLGAKAAASKILKALKASSGVDAAETNLKTSRLAGDENAAKANLKELGAKLDKDAKSEIDSRLGLNSEGEPLKGGKIQELGTELGQLEEKFENLGSIDELNGEKAKLNGERADLAKDFDAAKKEHAKLDSEIKGYKKELAKDPLAKGVKEKLDAAQTKFDEAGQKVKDLGSKIEDCDKGLKDVDAKIKERQELVGADGNGGKIGDLRKELKGLQEKYCNDVDAIEGEYRQKFEDAGAKYREALKSDDKAAIEGAKTEFENAQKEYEYVHAAGIEAKIENGGLPRESVAGQCEAIDQQRLDFAEKEFAKCPEHAEVERKMGTIHIVDGMVQAAGQMMQQVVQQVSQLMQAKAHALGAKEQEARNELDQINDLFANCQKLLEAVLQAMAAVIQAESQSVDTTIQGLRG